MSLVLEMCDVKGRAGEGEGKGFVLDCEWDCIDLVAGVLGALEEEGGG